MTIGRKIWLCMMRLLAAMVVSTSAGAQPPAGQVSVMTQNMNVGNFGTLGIGTPEAVAQFFKETVDTNPKDRAAAIANEIQANKPDLVALQEVGLLRRGPADDPKIPATEVVHDQLQLLREALTGLSEDYDTVAVIPNSDVQLVAAAPGLISFVVRVTDRTVILARASSSRLKLSNVQVEEFLAKPAFPTGALASGETMSASLITGTFGWGSVDVEVEDRKFRFVTTHLTPVDLTQQLLVAIQERQALELIQSAGKPDLPGGSVLPVVYVGDFNTVAGLGTYQILVGNSGRIDAWLKKNGMAASCPEPRPVGDHDRSGCTCCQNPKLNNPMSELDHRVDLVIVPPGTDIAEVKLIGADPADRTPSGLWPSDHAGVVVSFSLPSTRKN